jgi:hypothetical protein
VTENLCHGILFIYRIQSKNIFSFIMIQLCYPSVSLLQTKMRSQQDHDASYPDHFESFCQGFRYKHIPPNAYRHSICGVPDVQWLNVPLRLDLLLFFCPWYLTGNSGLPMKSRGHGRIIIIFICPKFCFVSPL